MLLDPDRSIIRNRHKRGGLRSRLVDIPALQHTWHDDDAVPFHNAALVNMAERPIVEARGLEIGNATWRIGIMPRSPCEARMHYTNICGSFDWWFESWQQAFRRLRLGKAQAVNRDGDATIGVLDGDGFGATAENRDRLRKRQLSGDLRHCIVITANDEHADACFIQPADLFCKEAGRLHRRLLPVIKIARKQ